jgi:antitoxin VapB
MALIIDHPETEQLIREFAAKTGQSVDEAISSAIRSADAERISKTIQEIHNRVAKLTVLDDRTPDEILGYDDCGLPH